MDHTVIFLLFLDGGFKFHFGQDGYNNTEELFLSVHSWDGWFLPKYFFIPEV